MALRLTVKFPSALPAMFVISFLTFPGCGTTRISSDWTNGTLVRPKGGLAPLDDKRIAARITNNGEFVVVELAVADPLVRRAVMRMGLKVWFDKDGGRKKSFGIHYPLPPEFPRNESEPRSPDGASRFESLDEERLAATRDLEICGPGSDERHRMTFAETEGIDVRIEARPDTLFYRLRVPLADQGRHPFSIESAPGARIGIGIDLSPSTLAKRTRPSGDGGIGDRPPAEGERTGGEGRRGGMRGGPGGMGEGRGGRGAGGGMLTLETWLTSQLSEPTGVGGGS